MMRTIKVLSVIEATTVTGPAKNLLNFNRLVRSPLFQESELPRVEVSIVTFHRSHTHGNGLRDYERSASPNAFVAAARAEGIEVDVIRESFRFQPSIIRRLRAIVAQRRPDIIQTHMVKSHFLIKLAGLARKYPWIAYHHGYTTTDLKMQAYNQLNRWSLPSATRVITVCDAFAKQLSRTGVRADRIVVCHNSVAAPRRVTNEEQQALKGKLAIAADERVVLAVGRLSREKGQRDLIDAGAVLNRMESALKFKLVVVGEGPERESLERASREQGLRAQVLFIDHVGEDAVGAFPPDDERTGDALRLRRVPQRRREEPVRDVHVEELEPADRGGAIRRSSRWLLHHVRKWLDGVFLGQQRGDGRARAVGPDVQAQPGDRAHER